MGFGAIGRRDSAASHRAEFFRDCDGILPSLTFSGQHQHPPDVSDCRFVNKHFATIRARGRKTSRRQCGYSAGTCRAWDSSFADTIVAAT